MLFEALKLSRAEDVLQQVGFRIRSYDTKNVLQEDRNAVCLHGSFNAKCSAGGGLERCLLAWELL